MSRLADPAAPAAAFPSSTAPARTSTPQEPAMTAAAPAARTAPAAERPSASILARTSRFALASTGIILRRGAFLGFTVVMPAAMFLMFNALFSSEGAGTSAAIMVNMAAYGGLGAALNAGALIQVERENGWMRQLMIAGLPPRSFVIGRVVAALAVVLPALLGVVLAAYCVGVRPEPLETAATIASLWVALMPMILLGLALGLALPPSAVQPATTVALMAMAILGGLWFPADAFPGWLQAISRATPTYWIGEIGRSFATGAAFPLEGLGVLGGWTGALVVAAALLVRRSARASRR